MPLDFNWPVKLFLRQNAVKGKYKEIVWKLKKTQPE